MTKEEKIYNQIIGKLNAIKGIHPIEHLDGMGSNRNTQWYHGSAMKAPLLKPVVRSTSHTSVVDKTQLDALHVAKSELLKLVIDPAIKTIMMDKIKHAIGAINASTKERPLTEVKLLNILHTSMTGLYSPTRRKRHTSKYVKHLVKQMGRKRAKIKMAQYEKVSNVAR